MEKVIRFFNEEDGVTMIEYGLIASLIAVVILSLLASIGTSISGIFQTIASTLGGGS